jgi:O-antigen/teichoic acid export membrane protein
MAPSLFVVLFDETWLPSVVPFQVLCVGGVLRLYDGYASHANEALGGIWAQVRRQALGAVLVAVGAWGGSMLGGIVGAAVGVTLALAVLSAMMQTLVSRLTGLTWSEMLTPQLPGLVCAAGLVVVLLTVEAVSGEMRPGLPAWQLLAAQVLAGAAFYVAFLACSPFRSVRELVRETLMDLGISRRLQAVRWLPSGLLPR